MLMQSQTRLIGRDALLFQKFKLKTLQKRGEHRGSGHQRAITNDCVVADVLAE